MQKSKKTKTDNALKICDLVSLTDVMVSKGASEPLVRFVETAPGFMGIQVWTVQNCLYHPGAGVRSTGGYDYSIGKASTEPVTLLPTGPLTNIALALTKAPEIKKNIEEIVLMAAVHSAIGTPTAEFNIWADPEAARKVFESGIPTVVMGLDITHQALATKEVIEQVNKIDNHVSTIVGELLVFFASTYKEMCDFDGAPVHDVLTVAYLVAPELFKMKDVNIVVETKGEFTAGTTLIDLHGVTGREVNAKFGVELDVEGFWKLMIDALKKY